MKLRTKIIIIALSIFVGIGILLFLQKNSLLPIFTNKYTNIIKKIDNKETFSVLIVNDSAYGKEMKKTCDYYKDVYGIKYIYLDEDHDDTEYKKLIKKLGSNLTGKETTIFAYIEKGVVKSSLAGEFYESSLKDFLINNGLIEKKYKDIDTIVIDKYNDSFKDDKSYNILYIDGADKNLYQYRKLLVKNKIKSYIVYVNNLGQIDTEKYFKKKLKFDSMEDNNKLPVIIKIKNGKIESSYTNISLKEFVNKIK